MIRISIGGGRTQIRSNKEEKAGHDVTDRGGRGGGIECQFGRKKIEVQCCCKVRNIEINRQNFDEKYK